MANFRPSDGKKVHSVVCSRCGKDAQVTFKPRENKAVLCDECFKDSKLGKYSPQIQPASVVPSSSLGQEMSSSQFDILNAKLDRILAVLSELELTDEEELDVDLSEEEMEEEDFDDDSPNKVLVEDSEDEAFEESEDEDDDEEEFRFG